MKILPPVKAGKELPLKEISDIVAVSAFAAAKIMQKLQYCSIIRANSWKFVTKKGNQKPGKKNTP